MYRPFLLIVSLISAMACSDNQSQEAPTFDTQCETFDALDREMLDLHEEIKVKYKDDKLFLKHLQSAQIYWIQYRDRHLHTLFPKGYDAYRKTYERKQVNECKCMELARLTKLRIEDLKLWISRDKPGWDDCPGSME